MVKILNSTDAYSGLAAMSDLDSARAICKK
jgi:hypothetical protein